MRWHHTLALLVLVVALIAGSRANDVYRWGTAVSGNELAMSHQDSVDAYLGTAIIDWAQLTAAAQELADSDSLGSFAAADYITTPADSGDIADTGVGFADLTVDGAADTEVLTYVSGIGPRWRPAGTNPFGAEIDWAELSTAAAELADDDSLGGEPASAYSQLGASIDWAELSAAAQELADADSLGSLAAADYATASSLNGHAAATTAIHGVGASTVASLADIATPTITDYTNAGHIHEGATSGGQLELTALSTAANENVDQDSLDLGGTQYDADTWFTTGEVDTTAVVDAQWNAKIQDYAGTHRRSWSLTLEDPTNTEDFSVAFTMRAVTITEMRAVVRGTTPSVTWTIRHGTDRSLTGAEVVTSGTATTSTTTGSDVTTFNDATIVADSFVWLETTATSGTVDEFHVTVVYRED